MNPTLAVDERTVERAREIARQQGTSLNALLREDKRARARDALAPLVRERRAVISTQILQELFAAATRKLRIPAERARSHVEKWSKLDVVVIRPEIILGAIDLHRLHALSFWDALVIKAASVAGCARLLSEDLNHGQAIEGVTIENPFR